MGLQVESGPQGWPGAGTLARSEQPAKGRSRPVEPKGADCRTSEAANILRCAAGQADRPANDENAVTRDRRDWNGTKPTVLSYMRHAQQRSGRHPLDLVRGFIPLRRSPGRLTWPEYVQYGVYDTTRYSPAEQARFISNTLHWPITHACCDMAWQATTEDKWLCARILAGSSVRMPQTLAVIDKTDRIYPGTDKIATAGQLRDFMTSRGALPVFAKENRGICSFGAFLVLDADQDGMLLKGHGRLGYGACMDQLVGATPYLLQAAERNHAFFERYTDSLATVRVCVLLGASGIRIPFAVLKLPARANVADSFWRPGNLACALDVRDGKVLTVRSKDPLGTTDYECHPDSGQPLLGEVVPMWDRVLELTHACAPMFAPVRYQSMDIAVTQQGPVLIEINTGGGFDLPQLASGEGFLTDEVRDFFRTCGFKKL